MKEVLRTETHVINKNHRLFSYCDVVCFKSKNLYNFANYIIRQEFISSGKIISAFDLNKQLKGKDVFKALPAKTSQQIIIKLGQNWKSFLKAVKDWSKNKSKYPGKPKIPSYKEKDGRNVTLFDYQQGSIKNCKYRFPKTEEYIETNVRKEDMKQIQIVPYGSCYKICIIYKKEIVSEGAKNDDFLAIDLGVDNLATLTNNIGLQPIVINGRALKSMNQYYNKKLGKFKSYVGNKSSNRIKKLSHKRNNKINTYFHQVSRYIIDYCKDNNIDNIVVGKNKGWKVKSKMSKQSNQKFVQIPFEKFMDQLIYKGEDVGINVIVIDEAYTSKSSFLDNDILPSKFGEYEFSGKRIKRGLYKSKEGILINADVNGSYNILRKCNPQFKYDEGIEGVSLHPFRVNIGANKG